MKTEYVFSLTLVVLIQTIKEKVFEHCDLPLLTYPDVEKAPSTWANSALKLKYPVSEFC